MFQVVKLSSLDILGLLCNGSRLSTVLILPSNATVNTTHISKTMCSVDKDTAVNITQWIIAELNIGNLLKTVCLL